MANPSALIAGLFWKLCVVLLLILACAKAWRRYGRYVPGQKQLEQKLQSQVQLGSTVTLAPGKLLHVVTIGEERFLVASSQQGINLISRLEAPQKTVEPESIPLGLAGDADQENSTSDWFNTFGSRLFGRSADEGEKTPAAAGFFSSTDAPKQEPKPRQPLFRIKGRAEKDANG